jgi:hypothetical protein
MAENEILDFGGRRWQRSRAALALANLGPTAIAECIADDLNQGLNLQLRKAFKGGKTLHDILRATEGNSAAARAAVQSFQDRSLAQLVQNATKVAGSTDPFVVASCAAELLLATVRDRMLVNAGKHDTFQDHAQRQALGKAVEAELEARRSGIVATIAASLTGQPAMRLRRGSTRQPSTPRTASALVNVSLGIRPRPGGDGPRHG